VKREGRSFGRKNEGLLDEVKRRQGVQYWRDKSDEERKEFKMSTPVKKMNAHFFNSPRRFI
jgi:hypothetical protein